MFIDPFNLAPDWIRLMAGNMLAVEEDPAKRIKKPLAVAFFRIASTDHRGVVSNVLRDRTPEVEKMIRGLVGWPENYKLASYFGTGADFGKHGFKPVGAGYVYHYRLMIIGE